MEEINKSTEEKQFETNIWDDQELAELLFISEENRDTEIIEAHEAEIEGEEIIEAPEIQDTELAYELYHKTLQPLLRKALKNASKEAKSYIREQVNLLLKEGHKRGRDGKQAYYYRLQQAIDIINKWENLCCTDKIPPTESKIFRLYCMFQDEVKNLVSKLKK